MKINKDTDKIGTVVNGANFNQNHLDRANSLMIVELKGGEKARIEVYGPMTNQGRLRLRYTEVKINEAAAFARSTCQQFKILRENVQVTSEA
jgi:hypothetical protein